MRLGQNQNPRDVAEIKEDSKISRKSILWNSGISEFHTW